MSNQQAAIDRAGRDMARLRDAYLAVKREIQRTIVGNDDVVDGVLTGLLVNGHVLLEGIPGLGKTSLVHALARALHLEFARIQFTPDLMPGDIIGTHVLKATPSGERTLQFQPGPVFAQVVLADEINRATPKTQSALLEAMQEGTVTVGRTTHPLRSPFLVLATQNPLEMEGTYPLPEAQLDRFLFKLRMRYPTEGELHEILDRTTSTHEPTITPVLSGDQVLELRAVARSVPVARPVQDYAIRLTLATHPDQPSAPDLVRRCVRYGSSPRGAQALVLAAKVHALLHDRPYVAADDVRAFALPALRHRVLLNFEGEAERVDVDQLLRDILGTVRGPET